MLTIKGQIDFPFLKLDRTDNTWAMFIILTFSCDPVLAGKAVRDN